MNIIDLAKQANIDNWWDSGNEMREVLDGHLETFARLVIESHLKGVDMEPAITRQARGLVVRGDFDAIATGETFFTAYACSARASPFPAARSMRYSEKQGMPRWWGIFVSTMPAPQP